MKNDPFIDRPPGPRPALLAAPGTEAVFQALEGNGEVSSRVVAWDEAGHPLVLCGGRLRVASELRGFKRLTAAKTGHPVIAETSGTVAVCRNVNEPVPYRTPVIAWDADGQALVPRSVERRGADLFRSGECVLVPVKVWAAHHWAKDMWLETAAEAKAEELAEAKAKAAAERAELVTQGVNLDGLSPDAQVHVVAFWSGAEVGTFRVDQLAAALTELTCDGTRDNSQPLQDALLAGPFGPHGDALKIAAGLGLSIRVAGQGGAQ